MGLSKRDGYETRDRRHQGKLWALVVEIWEGVALENQLHLSRLTAIHELADRETIVVTVLCLTVVTDERKQENYHTV